MEKLTTAIKTVKEDIRLKEWSEQVAAQQASGMSVQKWCAECIYRTDCPLCTVLLPTRSAAAHECAQKAKKVIYLI